jgi:hypothetical protein
MPYLSLMLDPPYLMKLFLTFGLMKLFYDLLKWKVVILWGLKQARKKCYNASKFFGIIGIMCLN